MRVAAVLVPMVMLLSGCGMTQRATEKAAEKVAEKAVETATGVSVNQKDHEVTIKGKDGEEVTLKSAEGQLPEGFPLALPPGGKVLSSTSMKSDGKQGWIVQVESDGDVKQVADFYEAAHKEKGFEISRTEMAQDGQVTVLLTGESAKESTFTTITKEKGQKVTTSIMLGAK